MDIYLLILVNRISTPYLTSAVVAVFYYPN